MFSYIYVIDIKINKKSPRFLKPHHPPPPPMPAQPPPPRILYFTEFPDPPWDFRVRTWLRFILNKKFLQKI